MSKGERIYAEAMGQKPREGYPVLEEDHPFLISLVRFMSNKKRWLGTASDLVLEMKDYDTPPSTASKLLHKFDWELFKSSGLHIEFRRTNRRRIIEIRRNG